MSEQDSDHDRDDEGRARIRVHRRPDVAADRGLIREQRPALECKQERDHAEESGHGPGKEIAYHERSTATFFHESTLIPYCAWLRPHASFSSRQRLRGMTSSRWPGGCCQGSRT